MNMNAEYSSLIDQSDAWHVMHGLNFGAARVRFGMIPPHSRRQPPVATCIPAAGDPERADRS